MQFNSGDEKKNETKNIRKSDQSISNSNILYGKKYQAQTICDFSRFCSIINLSNAHSTWERDQFRPKKKSAIKVFDSGFNHIVCSTEFDYKALKIFCIHQNLFFAFAKNITMMRWMKQMSLFPK